MSKKIFNISVLAILVIGLIVGSYLWKNLSQRPVFSQTKVERGNIRETVTVSGKVEPVETSDLGFENGGKVTKLTHVVGDRVKAGELLAESNSDDLQAQLAAANAQKKSAQAILDEDEQLVGKESYKLKSLKNTSTTTFNDRQSQKEQLDAQKALVESQEAQVKAATDNIGMANSQLEMTRIYAPYSGVISRLDAQLGEVEQSNVPFMTVFSDGRFRIEAYVSELDAKNIQAGDKAAVTFSGQGQNSFDTQVAQVYPAGQDVNNVSNYKIILDISGDVSELKSGMTANISIATQEKINVLLVPQKAIFQEGDKKFVYVTDGTTRDKKEIGTGIYGDNGIVEIVSGLNVGDNILILSNN